MNTDTFTTAQLQLLSTAMTQMVENDDDPSDAALDLLATIDADIERQLTERRYLPIYQPTLPRPNRAQALEEKKPWNACRGCNNASSIDETGTWECRLLDGGADDDEADLVALVEAAWDDEPSACPGWTPLAAEFCTVHGSVFPSVGVCFGCEAEAERAAGLHDPMVDP